MNPMNADRLTPGREPSREKLPEYSRMKDYGKGRHEVREVKPVTGQK